MTDARLPGRWLVNTQMMGLSDRAWRVFTAALMLSAEQGTDGSIPRVAFRFLYPEDIGAHTLDELSAAGLIAMQPDGGFLILEWTKTQSAAADVERQRERNRTKNKTYRDRKKAGEMTGHDPGQAPRTGQERLGQAEDRQSSIGQADSSEANAVTSWPVASIPNSDAA